MFIHDALEELITCGETAIRAPQLRKTLVDLNKVDPNTATTGFEEQFKVHLYLLSHYPEFAIYLFSHIFDFRVLLFIY